MSITRRYYRTLPRWGKRLSRRFVAAYSKPAGLWLPNDVVNKAYDFSSNRNIGTLNGGIAVAPGGFGVLGSSWVSAGTGLISGALALSVNDNFWMRCVFSPGILNSTIRVVSFNGQYSANGYGFIINSTNTLNVLAEGSAFSSFATGYSLSVGVVYDALFVRQAGINTMYVNGVKWATSVQTFNVPTGGNYLFGQSNAGSIARPFVGKIYLQSYGLTPLPSDSQVSSLYQSLLTGEPYPLFEPQTVRRGYGIRSIVGGSSFRFRRTLSDYGTRVGSRQTIG